MVKIEDYNFHELCLIFPFNQELIDELVKDIKENGQIEPIMMYKNEVLDGRHRVHACIKLNMIPLSMNLPMDIDPKAYVVAKNMKRRDLSAVERIETALKLDKWNTNIINSKTNALIEYKHNKKIAIQAKSTPETVKKVKEIIKIAKTNPKIKEALEKAKKTKISIDTVYTQAKNPKKTIKQIQKEKEPIEREINNKLRENLSSLKQIYKFVKERCIELKVWDKVWEVYKPQKSIEPTIEELRKAELI